MMNALITTLFSILAILSLISSVIAAPVSEIQSNTFYVKPGETGDCLGWSTACELQTALSLAEPGDQIWVAAGIYLPTTGLDREASFSLESGVAIYGGFPTNGGTWEDRDWVNNLTILSGDLGIGGDIADNSYHVVTGSGVDETAILDGFTISSGNANNYLVYDGGGGMYNANGSPTLSNLTFSGNYTTGDSAYGGGMYNLENSNPTLTDVTFSENSATHYGGGMFNRYSSPTLTDVTFSDNLAAHGGGVVNYYSNPSLTNVTFSENTANQSGGGMFNWTSSLTLTNVTFLGNSAGFEGGGMFNSTSSPTLTNVTFSGNSVDWGGRGGGIYNGESSPTLTNVTLSGNLAEEGGGIFNDYHSNPTLTDVTFSGNTADYGGGMCNYPASNPSLTGAIFYGNTADYGGGMVNHNSNPSLMNVTFSGNGALFEGGGMYNKYSSSPTLTNVTFFDNSSEYGGGIYNSDSSNPTLMNAIVWGNTPDQIYNLENSSPIIIYSDIQGGYTGTGNIDDDPLLGSLADNGGFTQTHALHIGSPAIDAGDPTVCPATDQRGFLRPFDGNGDGVAICDMGAYESEIIPVFIYLPLIVK